MAGLLARSCSTEHRFASRWCSKPIEDARPTKAFVNLNGEPALLDLKQSLTNECKFGELVPEDSNIQDSRSNGPVECATLPPCRIRFARPTINQISTTNKAWLLTIQSGRGLSVIVEGLTICSAFPWMAEAALKSTRGAQQTFVFQDLVRTVFHVIQG